MVWFSDRRVPERPGITLSRRSYGRLIALAAAGAALPPMTACANRPSSAAPGHNLHPVFVLSPDGRFVAFNGGERGIGQYEWRTGRLHFVPIPAEFSFLGWPSYSADGGRIVGVADIPRKDQVEGGPWSKLGIVDVVTHEMAAVPIAEIGRAHV